MSALNSKSGRPYTFEEEVWSCAIHGLGIVLSIAGLTTLVALAARYRDVWTVVSTAVFGVSMIVLYTASTIYHAVPNLDLKRHLKKFDHISIYYLIAGSYTPFLLVCMRGTLGWTIFIASKQLVGALPPIGLKFLVLGGFFYTAGILFYVWKSRKYTHAIWHGFVLTGTIMHFFAVLYSCVLI